MLVPIRAVVMPPVQAGMVHAVPVPALEDVDLAVVGPGEGLRGEQPERGPDPGCAGRGERCGERAALAVECLVGDEARAGVLVFRGGVANCS